MELGHVEGKGKKDVVSRRRAAMEVRAKFCEALSISQNKWNDFFKSKKGSEYQITC